MSNRFLSRELITNKKNKIKNTLEKQKILTILLLFSYIECYSLYINSFFLKEIKKNENKQKR